MLHGSGRGLNFLEITLLHMSTMNDSSSSSISSAVSVQEEEQKFCDTFIASKNDVDGLMSMVSMVKVF